MEKIKEVEVKVQKLRKELIDIADDIADELHPCNEKGDPNDPNKVYALLAVIKAAKSLNWMEADLDAAYQYFVLPF